MSSATVFARAAVAGNPSDGFGGAVCSVLVPMFSATAKVDERPAVGANDSISLVSATIERFCIEVQPVVEIGVSLTTTIPRSVGLAGSSAIVIATTLALARHCDVQMTPMEVARLAHTVERVDLSIAGGWQDQLVQSHGFSALVECAEPHSVEPIAVSKTPPIPLYLAWSDHAAEASGHAHARLREERSSDDPTMQELAGLAREAAASLATRDIHAVKHAMNATFDLRRTLMDIAPAQAKMVETARSLGAAANFAGSGGSILGVLPKDGEQFMQKLREVGYEVVSWEAS